MKCILPAFAGETSGQRPGFNLLIFLHIRSTLPTRRGPSEPILGSRAGSSAARGGRSVAVMLSATILLLAATAGAAPEPSTPVAAKPTPPDADHGLLGPVRLGPSIGVGAPEALQVGALVTYARVVGVSFAWGTLPKVAVPGTGGATITRSSLEVDLRGYPFRGPFFVGVGLGHARTRGSMDAAIRAYRTNIPASASARMEATYLSPKLGVLFVTRSGFAIGADAGVEIPISANEPEITQSSLGLTTPVEADNQLVGVARRVAKQPLPFLNVLRVAYMF